MIELFIFLMVTAAIVSWWQLMQGRQKARRAAGQVCSNHGLQLLDDTVSLSSVTWNRKAAGSVILVNYGFEFATNGACGTQKWCSNAGVSRVSYRYA